jgi:adenylate cyclase
MACWRKFASIVDAVRCAGDIQRAMADRDLDLAEERRLRFRIGVHLADVIADGGDVDGEGCAMCCKEACVDRATGSDATPI